MKTQSKQRSGFQQRPLTDTTRLFESLYDNYLRKVYEQYLAPVRHAEESYAVSRTSLIPVAVPSRPFSGKN